MHFVNKGVRKQVIAGHVGTVPGYTYLACDNARRKRTCDAKSVRYESVLTYVLDHLPDYRSFYQASQPSEKDRDTEIDAVSAQVAKTEETIARLLDTLEKVDSASAVKRLAEHESKLTTLKAQQVELTEKRTIREADGDDWEAYVEWYNRPVAPDEATEIFLGTIAHVASEIRRNVEKIIVEKGRPINVIPRSEGTLTL